MEKVRFNIDFELCRHALLHILNQLGNECDLHRLFKILYFAEQKHLAAYGWPITGDAYDAMKYGLVPNEIYHFFKQLRNKKQTDEYFQIENNYLVKTYLKADLDELAQSHIHFLNISITENKFLNFEQLSNKSHGLAWREADKNTNEIDFLLIAQEGGASEAMLQLIALNAENEMFINELEKKHSYKVV